MNVMNVSMYMLQVLSLLWCYVLIQYKDIYKFYLMYTVFCNPYLLCLKHDNFSRLTFILPEKTINIYAK